MVLQRNYQRAALLACLSLGAGEFIFSIVSGVFAFWPALMIAAILVAAFGYGFHLRGWQFAALFLLGASLILAAEQIEDAYYRERPWMREAKRHVRQGENEVRRELSRRVGIGLEHDREMAAVNRAILLGERYRLPVKYKQAFVESGTIHVFAISGLHVMAVASVISWLFSFMFIPRRFVGLATIPILWLYVWAIGMMPSATRAAIMATVYFAAPVFWRKSDGVMAWAAAFLLVHIVSPKQIADVGSALSFAVMLAVIAAAELVRDMTAWRARLVITIAAWAAGVPIAAHVFGRVTPSGILANLVLIFTAVVTVVSGVLGIVTSFISTTLAAHFNNLSALLTKTMVIVAEGVARLPWANVVVERWGYWQCGEWYVMLGLIWWLGVQMRRRGKRL